MEIRGMRGGKDQSWKLFLFMVFLLLLCIHESYCDSGNYLRSALITNKRKDALLPETSPTAAPLPFLPFVAPSPLTPFANSSIPKLSGLCTLNFSSVDSLMTMTASDCVASFAPYLANVICCPQLEATMVILVGQSSKDTNTLALNGTLAKPCLSDFEQILVARGANETLSHMCSIHPSIFTEGSCPVRDVNEFEATVDSSNLLAACEKIDLVNECCEQTCENAISEAATKLASKGYDLTRIDGSRTLSDNSTRDNDCKTIVHRWLASKLDPIRAKEVLRGLSNCKINKVCPLAFPNMNNVINGCNTEANNLTACCDSMESYLSNLQNQSFTTNLQAMNCASSLGLKLQKANVTNNIYNLCHISLKDFSLQVGSLVTGCLLPSLPSDVVLDFSSGFGFSCDLNDNIPAPWPSASQLPASSCKKTVKIPALPAAASGQNSLYSIYNRFLVLLSFSVTLVILFHIR